MNQAAEKIEFKKVVLKSALEAIGVKDADEIEAVNVIHKVQDLLTFWKDVYYGLKPGGKATVTAPYAKSNRAWLDPETKREIVEETFVLLNKTLREQNKVEWDFGEVDFDFVITYEGVDQAWANRAEEARTFAIKHYWNVVQEIKVILTKK